MKQVQDVIERLWDFIDKLNINTFRKFLADNIVGSVVVFSLIFWIPLSILVHCVDKRLDQQYEENTKSFYFPPSGQEMLSNLESASVRIVKPHPPPAPSSCTSRTAHFSRPPPPAQARDPTHPGASSSSTPVPDMSSVPIPDSAGGQRMATIQEDTSSDSHPGEEAALDDFTTAAACSLATRSSYEDLTERSPLARERRRLQRQDCIDTKETEC